MNTKRPLLRLPLIFASGLLLLHYPVTASAQYLYVANTNYIGLYDATTGAAINTNFISGLHYAQGMAVLGTNLFVANGDTLSIAEYNAFTGAVITTNFISWSFFTGNQPYGLAFSGTNLLVASTAGYIGEYNSTTGAAINTNFITGLYQPKDITISGNNLYVTDWNGTFSRVAEYDATTGAPINTNLTGRLYLPTGIAVTGTNLYVATSSSNKVSEFNATTGATISSTFISGLNQPQNLASLGTNLFVANYGSKSIAEYNAITGALISSNFITGLNSPLAMLVAAPEPSTYALFGLGGLALLIAARRRVA